MKLHLYSGANRVVFTCHYENCPKYYTEKRNLMNHIRSKHEGKKFLCPKCGSNMSSKQKLNQHIASHEIPERAKNLKKSTISLLIAFNGKEMSEKTSDDLLKLHLATKIDTTESEFSDY
jgi:predicted RNA-binding Zn-ribbon protein involved in translation (DUF1610 family)